MLAWSGLAASIRSENLLAWVTLLGCPTCFFSCNWVNISVQRAIREAYSEKFVRVRGLKNWVKLKHLLHPPFCFLCLLWWVSGNSGPLFSRANVRLRRLLTTTIHWMWKGRHWRCHSQFAWKVLFRLAWIKSCFYCFLLFYVINFLFNKDYYYY